MNEEIDLTGAINDNEESEEDEDYYSEENIEYRKELRRNLLPQRQKPYYPPYT